ncbi:MAG: AAA family ATPase [Eubacterium sp.]|nr:AAA family ATPase [Eubacterium sp.]
MIIKEINIISFGKIQNKKYTFSDGINVIYGENEAGKTTIQQFIKAMLFGLEKKRGRVAGADEYARYEPWEAPAYFSGSLIFETGGQQFLLERNFYHKEATVRLVNMGDLEELSVEKGDLAMLLGNVSKSAYENTYCIGQERIMPQAELGTMLSDERTNLTQTKDASFQLSAALDKLAQKKKLFEKQKKELETARQVQIGQLRSKQQLLETQIAQLDEKVRVQMAKENALEQQMRENKAKEAALDIENQQPKEPEVITRSHDRKKQWNPMVIVGVVGALVMQMLISWMHAPTMPCRVVQAVFAALIILGIVNTMRKNEALERTKEQEKQDNRNEISFKKRELQDLQKECYMEYRAAQAARETIAQELQEQEVLLENHRVQQEELEQISQEEKELLHEIDAIVLAAETMQRLAASLAEETDDFINGRMSQIISAITDGKYDDLRLENSKQLYLTENYHKRKPENYSQATMQQMYFAYRMAAGEMLAREEALPFLFDEAFASYDEVRLKEVLHWLGQQPQQVLIFTCRRLEGAILQEMGQNFTAISL